MNNTFLLKTTLSKKVQPNIIVNSQTVSQRSLFSNFINKIFHGSTNSNIKHYIYSRCPKNVSNNQANNKNSFENQHCSHVLWLLSY